MAEELVGSAVYSYNLTVETPLDIDSMIYVLSPDDLPMLQGVNADGFPVLPSSPTGNTLFYWQEEEVPLPRGIVDEALDDSETAITMTTGDAVKFAVGDAVRVEDEIMVVTAVDTSTEVLTVTRGSAATTNTTAASHGDQSIMIGLGSLLIEGSVGATNFQGRDKYSNYCQIFSKKIQMSATEQSIRKYGVPSELARQTANMLQNYAVGLENACAYGVKHIQSSDNRRQTGGLDHYITTNNDSSSEWLTVDSIQAMQQLAYDNGGAFDVIVGNPQVFQALNNITGSERVQTQDITSGARGRRKAQFIETEYGTITLIRNRWLLPTDAFCIKRGNVKRRVLRPMSLTKLAKSDDTDTYMVVSEAGFQVQGEAHMGKFSALNVNAALPADLV